MVESASDARRRRTARSISQCAQRLAIEHGLDGFTMDDLAACADVSRRTLFNYVPSKVDAVLGVPGDEPDPELLADFLAGGPTGHLMTDVKELICTSLSAYDVGAAEVDRIRRLIRSDQRLYGAVHERLVDVVTLFSGLIEQREGEIGPLTAQLVTRLTISLLDVALDESLTDASLDLTQHFDRVFTAAAALMGPAPSSTTRP